MTFEAWNEAKKKNIIGKYNREDISKNTKEKMGKSKQIRKD